jgi:hypothetical protein
MWAELGRLEMSSGELQVRASKAARWECARPSCRARYPPPPFNSFPPSLAAAAGLEILRPRPRAQPALRGGRDGERAPKEARRGASRRAVKRKGAQAASLGCRSSQ